MINGSNLAHGLSRGVLWLDLIGSCVSAFGSQMAALCEDVVDSLEGLNWKKLVTVEAGLASDCLSSFQTEFSPCF